jgi:hypothetical protein
VQQVILIDSNQWIPAEDSEQQQQQQQQRNHTFIRVTPNAGPSIQVKTSHA